jgi:hypothetical protein
VARVLQRRPHQRLRPDASIRKIGGDLSPLTLARYPNRDHEPKQWSSGNIDGYTIFVDALTAPRVAAWARQLREDPHSIITHYLGGLGWDGEG